MPAAPNKEADNIIMESVRGQFDPQQFMQNLDQYLQQHPETKLVKLDNAVFMVTPRPNSGIEVHTFSTGKDIKGLVQTYRKLAQMLKQAKVKYVVSETTDMSAVRAVQMTGLNVKVTQKAVNEGKGPQPGFEIRVEL